MALLDAVYALFNVYCGAGFEGKSGDKIRNRRGRRGRKDRIYRIEGINFHPVNPVILSE